MFDRYADLEGQPPQEPAHLYMTNGSQLVEILEKDRSGALAEDVCSHLLVSIEARDCCEAGEACRPGRWRQVTPARDAA